VVDPVQGTAKPAAWQSTSDLTDATPQHTSACEANADFGFASLVCAAASLARKPATESDTELDDGLRVAFKMPEGHYCFHDVADIANAWLNDPRAATDRSLAQKLRLLSASARGAGRFQSGDIERILTAYANNHHWPTLVELVCCVCSLVLSPVPIDVGTSRFRGISVSTISFSASNNRKNGGDDSLKSHIARETWDACMMITNEDDERLDTIVQKNIELALATSCYIEPDFLGIPADLSEFDATF